MNEYINYDILNKIESIINPKIININVKKNIDIKEKINKNNKRKNNLFKKQAEKFRKKYIDIIDNSYKFIDNIDDINIGDYIKYITINGDIKSGGFLIKIYNKNKITKTKLLLKNHKNIWTVKFYKNFFYYKEYNNKDNNMRNLFMSIDEFLEKTNNDIKK